MATIWSGALQPKKKQELQDLALALNVDSNGTKDEIHERIKIHLASNPGLSTDDRFAGLYSRRKPSRSTKEHEASPSADEGHMITRRGTRGGSGIFPSPEPLRKRIAHEEHADPNSAVVHTPARTSSPVRSVIDTIKRNMPNRPEADAVARVVEEQSRIVYTEADKAFHTSRVFLSNAKNISYLTMLAEFLYGAYHFIPWKYWVITTDSILLRAAPTHVGEDSPLSNTRYIQLPVVPSYWLQTPWPYTTAIFWAIPTVILPMIAGHLVSFRSASNVRRHHAAGEPDPLTMAIVRIALVFVSGWSVPWDHLGLDGQLRLILACLSGAFALSEALGERKESVHHRAPVHHNSHEETAVALRKKPVATATPSTTH